MTMGRCIQVVAVLVVATVGVGAATPRPEQDDIFDFQHD